MNKIKQSILAIIIGLVLSAGVSYAYSTWSNPSANPPGNNTDTPINTGPGDQIKAGALRIGNPTLGFVVDGASSFKGQSQFLNPVIFKGQITIDKSPESGAILTSDAGGNASWKMPKTEIVVSSDDSGYYNYENGKKNNWNNGYIKCDTLGSSYVRTGCTATCTGDWKETDLTPLDATGNNNNGCRLGTNDACQGKSNPVITVRTICMKVGN